jgi:hypothetical protein
MEAEPDVGHRRTKPLAGDDGIFDRCRGRKNSGEKRMQRAAIIGVVRASGAPVISAGNCLDHHGLCCAFAADAAIWMRASVMAIAIGAMSAGVVAIGMFVTDMRDGDAESGTGLRERRRDDAGKLGKHEQGNQCADKARYRREPLHQCFARTVWRLGR